MTRTADVRIVRRPGRPASLVAGLLACPGGPARTIRQRAPHARCACGTASATTRDSRSCCGPIPIDPRIDVTSDSGELGREGDAHLHGNVNDPHGAEACSRRTRPSIDANKRSIDLRGDVEYLDPAVARARARAALSKARASGSSRAPSSSCSERSVRGAAQDASLRENGTIDLSGVKYTACPQGNEDWRLAAGEISIDQKTQTRHGPRRASRIHGRADLLHAVDLVSGRRPAQVRRCCSRPSARAAGAARRWRCPGTGTSPPNYDATFTARWYSTRGFRIDPEFRYLTERSRGILDVRIPAARRPDRRSAQLRRAGATSRASSPRTRLVIDAADVSDTDYFEDFGVGFEGTSVTFLNRLAELRHDTDHWSLRARAQDYQVIDRELADRGSAVLDPAAVHGARTLARPAGRPVGVASSPNVTNFQRDLGPDGVRSEANPSLELARGPPWRYLAASAGWRYTQLCARRASTRAATNHRHAMRRVASLDAGFVLERAAGSQGQKRLQTLEPRMLYLYVPYRNQDDLPVFDTGRTRPEPGAAVPRPTATSAATGSVTRTRSSVGVTTRLLDADGGRQFLSATLGQAYYFEDSARAPARRAAAASARRRIVIAELELTAFRDWNAASDTSGIRNRSRSAKSEMHVQYSAGHRSRGQRRATGSAAICSSSSTSRRPGRSTAQWRGFARWVYSLQEREDARPVRRPRVRVVLLGPAARRPRRFVSSRTGDVRYLDRPAAGTQGTVECRSGQRSFPARCDSWILRAPARFPVLRCP